MSEAVGDSERQTSPYARRLAWALRESGAALPQALLKDRSRAAVPLKALATATQAEALTRLIMEQADPTSNKRFTSWLVREYAAGRLILEDLGSANETLSLFQRYAPRLKPAERDIQRYGNLTAAWEAVRGFAERDEAQSNKAQKALDRAKAHAESRILRQDPDGFTVAVPLTEFAAKWWGRGTRWCTAAEKENQFSEYHEEAPLFVISIPRVGKFQAWLNRDLFYFMDAADQPVTPGFLRKNWTRLRGVFSLFLNRNGRILRHVPKECRDHDLCWQAVRNNGLAVRHVPKKFWCHDLFREAVCQTGKALRCISSEMRTPELCHAAVAQNGLAILLVPKEKRTPDLIRAAVANDGLALRALMPNERSSDLCRIAVGQNGLALIYVPRPLRDLALCTIAVQRDGKSIRHVPARLRTQEICNAAISGCVDNHRELSIVDIAPEFRAPSSTVRPGETLPWVPDKFKTYDTCLTAVRNFGWNLRGVPLHFRDSQMYLEAVRQDGSLITMVPEELRTPEICKIAVCQNSFLLFYVPLKERSLDICMSALSYDMIRHDHFNLIPKSLRDKVRDALVNLPLPSPAWSLELLDEWQNHLAPMRKIGVELNAALGTSIE